jgi:transcription antitermination factor NusG
MPRFQVGDTVEINSVITSKFTGQVGVVREVHPHRRGKTTLDRYTVEFPNLDRHVFWDIQLNPTEPTG